MNLRTQVFSIHSRLFPTTLHLFFKHWDSPDSFTSSLEYVMNRRQQICSSESRDKLNFKVLNIVHCYS